MQTPFSLIESPFPPDFRALYQKLGIEAQRFDSARGLCRGSCRVTVTLAETKTPQSLEFGLGNNMSHASLCGTKATLEIEDMDYDLIEALGENPEGFRKSTTCKGLILTDDECDSMHIFWNHDTKHIDWWRL